MYLPTVKTKAQISTLKAAAFFRFFNTLVMSVPVGVPAVMIFSVVVAIQRLNWRSIAVLYPGQLKLAASVDIACFDKTGTLTGSEVMQCCICDAIVRMRCNTAHAVHYYMYDTILHMQCGSASPLAVTTPVPPLSAQAGPGGGISSLVLCLVERAVVVSVWLMYSALLAG